MSGFGVIKVTVAAIQIKDYQRYALLCCNLLLKTMSLFATTHAEKSIK